MKPKHPDVSKIIVGKLFNAKFFFSNLIVPCLELLLYCAVFLFFSNQVLPIGVNAIFTSRLGLYLIVPLVLMLIILFFQVRHQIPGFKDFTKPKEDFHPADLLLVLLPLSPVIQYILNNQGMLSIVDSLVILVFFFLFSVLLILVIPWILGGIGSTSAMKIVGLTFCFTITYMAILSQDFAWLGKGSLKVQLLFFFTFLFVAYFLYSLKNKWILYISILAFFLSNLILQLPAFNEKNNAEFVPLSEFKLISAVDGKEPALKPNVYLMVYDAYVPHETLMAYGIDNSEQEDYLREMGFAFYPHTYSLSADTMRSMGRVLNASLEIEGDLNSSVAGDGKVIQHFKKTGYTTYGIFPYDFMFRGRTPKYDLYTPEYSAPPFSHMLSAILIGEFRFDIGFYGQGHSEFVAKKELMLQDATQHRSFVYMHTNVPSHSQNSGACLPDEVDLYETRLKEANREMRQDLDMIIENDPSAIVIVAGDHGPFLTKNCVVLSGKYDLSDITRLDIQDRYGTFLAIKWPDSDHSQYDKITILQDIFPAIFAYLYQDPGLLETKLDPVIVLDNVISGATVNNEVISGGVNDGEPLFLSEQ